MAEEKKDVKQQEAGAPIKRLDVVRIRKVKATEKLSETKEFKALVDMLDKKMKSAAVTENEAYVYIWDVLD